MHIASTEKVLLTLCASKILKNNLSKKINKQIKANYKASCKLVQEKFPCKKTKNDCPTTC